MAPVADSTGPNGPGDGAVDVLVGIPLDRLSRPIHIGDYIAYGHALGRCAGIRVGKVLAIKYEIEETRWRGPQTNWKITVRGVDDDHSSWREVALCTRNGTLLYPQRTVRLTPDMVPQVYKDLLAGATL